MLVCERTTENPESNFLKLFLSKQKLPTLPEFVIDSPRPVPGQPPWEKTAGTVLMGKEDIKVFEVGCSASGSAYCS